MRILSEGPSEFRGGSFVNARTTLRYAGDAHSLNRFLAGLAACPGLPLTFLFKTARGDLGILQIHGITRDPRGGNGLGMTIRDKLVSPIHN